MSRSRKKIWFIGQKTAFYKKAANKKVRNYRLILSNGRSYRKIYCSWNIMDFYSAKYTKSQALKLNERDFVSWKAK